MALLTKIKDIEFGVGDRIKVHQKLSESGKSRGSVFEGIVLKIKGRGIGATFTVRRVGEANIGIERIFPINLPSIEKITIVKKGTEGVRRAKLYYIRKKSPTQIEAIFKKAAQRRTIKPQGVKKAKTVKKVVKRSPKTKKS